MTPVVLGNRFPESPQKPNDFGGGAAGGSREGREGRGKAAQTPNFILARNSPNIKAAQKRESDFYFGWDFF
jgi:hypothetical protein